ALQPPDGGCNVAVPLRQAELHQPVGVARPSRAAERAIQLARLVLEFRGSVDILDAHRAILRLECARTDFRVRRRFIDPEAPVVLLVVIGRPAQSAIAAVLRQRIVEVQTAESRLYAEEAAEEDQAGFVLNAPRRLLRFACVVAAIR